MTEPPTDGPDPPSKPESARLAPHAAKKNPAASGNQAAAPQRPARGPEEVPSKPQQRTAPPNTSAPAANVNPFPAGQAARQPTLQTPHRQWPAMVLSGSFHLIVLILLLWTVAKTTKGTGGAPDRPIGIAVVHRLPDRDVYQEAQTAQQQQTQQEQQALQQATMAAAAPPAGNHDALDLDGILAAIEATPAPVGGSGIAGDAAIGSGDLGSSQTEQSLPSTPTGTAELFGVSGSGRRYVYVMDRSDSMNGLSGLPLRSAKRELTRSLNSLTEKQQFQIIFYNDTASPFPTSSGITQMIDGQSDELKAAERYIESMKAFGGTKHKTALLMALRMRPDVIFFLTDATMPRLSSSELRDVQMRADSAGTTIHSIEFGSQSSGAANSFLRELAAMNGGQYQYVDVRTLNSFLKKPQ
ncbi:hypothetical protein SV7mr_02590 [Stieleria bergensis]|uniref:VWFA domain-containing protein n=1 Tax=Stieleria bergensis TaxID=2528025 RepID=A0A517SNT1_9BACT|nr:hypothetical protein SV7mr_02590 [Planctomycetes bacterium SV_7m_r]